jgi:G:T-mismatch repair DNA endonuclease (very short patch repair protein)
MESFSGVSKIACKFMDEYAAEYGVTIQHAHYNPATKQIEGTEHRPAEWPQKGVDGFYVDADGTNVAIEFLGDYWHGHPRWWPKGEGFKALFEKTETKLLRLKSLGYKVVYVWENDYKHRKALQSMSSTAFVLEDELEYKDF